MNDRPLLRSDDEGGELPLAERAFRLLRRRILHGDLPPGGKLKVEALQSATGLSSSPLREALNRLAVEGLVQAQDHRGFRAAPISVADLRDVYALRRVVEVAALEQSMTRGDDAWEAAVLAAFHRLERVEARVGSGLMALNDEWTERHRDFHLALYAACGSPRQIALIGQLFDQAERYRRLSARHRKEPRRKVDEHRALMDLALARKKATAREALIVHMDKTAENVAQVLGKVTALFEAPPRR
jgi:DNA-binding GntR family transcriptional regulator